MSFVKANNDREQSLAITFENSDKISIVITRVKLFDFLLVANLMICSFLLFGCSSGRNESLERKFIGILISHKYDSVNLISLREVFGDQWRKVCIQGPYESKSDFEKASGETVENYPKIKDNGYAFLIFYQNDKMAYVEVDSLNVMNLLTHQSLPENSTYNASRCTSIHSPYLYLQRDKIGEKKYYLNEKGN